MLNHIIVCGRLTADPELKQTNSGVDVCSFTLAVDRDFKNGDEKVADFIPVTVWRGTAKFVSSYFAKGRMAIVSGSLQTRKYEDKEGNKRTAFEIVGQNVYFADSKKDGNATLNPDYVERVVNGNQTGGAFQEVTDDSSELPF